MYPGGLITSAFTMRDCLQRFLFWLFTFQVSKKFAYSVAGLCALRSLDYIKFSFKVPYIHREGSKKINPETKKYRPWIKISSLRSTARWHHSRTCGKSDVYPGWKQAFFLPFKVGYLLMKRNFHFPLCVLRADDKYNTEATNTRWNKLADKKKRWSTTLKATDFSHPLRLL